MRVILQRVLQASVDVGGKRISQTGRGFLALVGISHADTAADAHCMIKKILSLKAFSDENGKHWTKNIKDLNLEILCVSQFTLQATFKGTKPDFHLAMPSEKSRLFYSEFLTTFKKSYKDDRIQDGAFGEMMQVGLINDGPVTFILDSKKESVISTDAPSEEAEDDSANAKGSKAIEKEK